MTEQRDLNRFTQHFNSEVREIASGTQHDSEPDFKENVFTNLVLETLEELGVTEEPQTCYYETRFGRSQIKVNGYSVGTSENVLDIFTSIFLDSDSVTPVSNEHVYQAIERARRLLDLAKSNGHEGIDSVTEAYSMVTQIQEALPTNPRIRVFLLSDGLINIKNKFRAKYEGTPFECEIWDIQRLFRARQNSTPRDSVEIDFEQILGSAIPCLKIEARSSEFDVFLTIIPGEALYSMYEHYGPRLLEFNVRSFLQARGNVNRGIRDTIRHEAERFIAYNNGISATADHITTIKLPDNQIGIKSIRGLQIVNGGQTTASIHRAKRVDRFDLSEIFVPTKICIIKPDKLEEFVPKISKYANTQNVIQMADFSANDSFHIEIERLSKRIWCPGEQGKWFYERARGQYQVAKAAAGSPANVRRFVEQAPPSRKFTKIDLAKYVQSWEQLPHIVSRGGQKNFVLLMEQLYEKRGEGWNPDEHFYKELIAKAIIFRAAQKLVRQERFPAYQANIVTYTVSYLSSVCGKAADFSLIWKSQGLSQALEALLQSWTWEINDGILKSANGRNVTEWCKKDDCWFYIRGLKLPMPGTTPPEIP